MRSKFILLVFGFIFMIKPAFSQDTISENFNGICEFTTAPGRTYSFDYTGANGVEWELKTLYSSSSWWGGIDDDGTAIEGTIHCGSLQWDESNSGYARARIDEGIDSLFFQIKYGFQLVGGYVKVMVDGIEVGRTEPLEDHDVHSYGFFVDAAGPADLSLIPVIEESEIGGFVLDNFRIIASDSIAPFFSVEQLDEYDPWMDTLANPLDTMRIFIYAEHCLEINGEFVDYFDMTDDVELTVGSVIDLIPGDSTNVYYWGSAVPASGSAGGSSSLDLYLPVNNSAENLQINTAEGKDTLSGMFTFINGNIDKDLILFKLTDAGNEYRFTYAYDSYAPTIINDTTNTDNMTYNTELAVSFYPNPIRSYAYFDTNKELNYYEVFDFNGRVKFVERSTERSGDGHYRLDLQNLDPGVWFIRFIYKDRTMDAVKVMVQ